MFKNGRYWSIRFPELVVKQTPEGMIVVSRHKFHESALKKAAALSKINGDIYAALSLIGNPRHDYKEGDIVDKDDVWWRARTNEVDRCSECLAQNIPDSLEYKCPNTRYHPVCDVVRHHRELVDLFYSKRRIKC